MRVTTLVTFVAAALVLGGCSSIPEDIRTPAPGPDVGAARANPGQYTGTKVRWGGTINEVSNLRDRTVITVVARPLDRRGQPLGDRRAQGRFFAEVDRFLDPEEYRAGRRVTVTGRFTGIRQSKIDQYVYDYPVVRVQNLYMWREYTKRDPYRYGPHYGPFWHWYSPFRHHHHGFIHDPWYYH